MPLGGSVSLIHYRPFECSPAVEFASMHGCQINITVFICIKCSFPLHCNQGRLKLALHISWGLISGGLRFTDEANISVY